MTIGKIPTSHPFFRSLDLITNKKVVDDLTKRHDISFSSHSVYQWNFLRYIIMFLGLLVLVEKETRERETREKVSRESLFLLLGTKEKEARETNMVWDPCFSISSPNCEERQERFQNFVVFLYCPFPFHFCLNLLNTTCLCKKRWTKTNC
jgi:hypothetical protein